MITKRSLKAKVAELEGDAGRHVILQAKLRNIIRQLMFYLHETAEMVGTHTDVTIDESFTFPEELIYEDKCSSTQITQAITEHPLMKAFSDRILELKAKAEKADVPSPMMPCPYCYNGGPILHGGCNVDQFIWCEDCHMRGPDFETIEEAINAWNNLPRRTTT